MVKTMVSCRFSLKPMQWSQYPVRVDSLLGYRHGVRGWFEGHCRVVSSWWSRCSVIIDGCVLHIGYKILYIYSLEGLKWIILIEYPNMMDIYGYLLIYLWIFMDIYGYLWIFMDICWYLWIFIDIFLGIYGCLWIFMDMYLSFIFIHILF